MKTRVQLFSKASLFFSLLFFLAACQSDERTTTHQEENNPIETPASENSSGEKNSKEVKHSNPEVAPVFFYMEDVEAKTGETICLDVKVKNFKQIETNQYSVNWNPEELEFVGIKNIKLKEMTQNNFGLTRTAQGNYGVSWFDPTLKSVTLPDGASLYQVCFVVKAPAGTEASIKFSGEPVAIEFSDVNQNLVGFSARRTHVKVK